MDHGGALKLDESASDGGKVTVIAAVTNKSCTRPVDKHLYDQVHRATYAGQPFFLPTADATSLICVSHSTKTLSCIDPTCDIGLRWEKDERAIESETNHGLMYIHEINGVSRPSDSCHLLFGREGVGLAIYARWSTATGALERSLRLPVGRKWGGNGWGGGYYEPASISQDCRWIAIISANSETASPLNSEPDRNLRIYDLEKDGKFVEMPIAQRLYASSWQGYQIVGIRNNDNVVLQSNGGFWEVDLRTARVRKRLFELPPKVPESK